MSKKLSFKNILKTLFFWSSIMFFVWILYKNAGDYTTILYTLNQANYVYLGWATVLAVGNLAIMSSIFKSNFSMFAPDITLGYLLPEVITFSFLTISSPLGVTGGSAYMIKNLVKKGNSYVKSIFSFFSTQLSINLGFFPILGITLWILKDGNHLNEYQIVASELLLLLNVAIITGILFILVLPNFSIRIAKFVGGIANRIFKSLFKHSVINTEKLSMYITEITETSGRFDKSVLRFLKTLILSILYHTINITILYIIFFAFNSTISPILVVVVYGIIALFSIVSPTPQGIGIVESLAQLGAISIGIQSETALVSILTYRLLTIWIPAIMGLLVFRSSKKQQAIDSN